MASLGLGARVTSTVARQGGKSVGVRNPRGHNDGDGHQRNQERAWSEGWTGGPHAADKGVGPMCSRGTLGRGWPSVLGGGCCSCGALGTG